MPRYKLTIEYDGRPFVGWQIQDNGASVQGALTAALAAFCGQKLSVHGAGRTDAGVHALGQVAHVDLEKDWRVDKVRDAVNAHLRPHPVAVLSAERVAADFDARRSAIRRHYLYRVSNRRPDLAKEWDQDTVRDALNAHLRPHPVAILNAQQVDASFDARFSAIRRHYLYRIVNRRADLALERTRAWRVPRRLDVDAMHAAAQRLVGKHDFTTFRSTECQAKSPVKTLDTLDIMRAGDDVQIRTSARSFLHNQVRSMVGSLALVGDGKWSADDLAAALVARDRSQCGPVAPPEGLYLVSVDY